MAARVKGIIICIQIYMLVDLVKVFSPRNGFMIIQRYKNDYG